MGQNENGRQYIALSKELFVTVETDYGNMEDNFFVKLKLLIRITNLIKIICSICSILYTPHEWSKLII